MPGRSEEAATEARTRRLNDVRLSAFAAELRRRQVWRALLAWGVVCFAVLQISEPILHAFHLPDALLTVVVVVLALGFPATVVLAWFFDLTRAGIAPSPDAAGDPIVPSSGSRFAPFLAGLIVAGALVGTAVAWIALRGRSAAGPDDGGAPIAPTADAPSIAVLPFADLSPEHDQEYLSDGVAQEIMSALAGVERLRVSGRTSSFSFKGKPIDLTEIGRKLHVATVLEGSVRRAGTRVRITADLVSTRDGFHLWSRTFDRELTDVFAIQGDIARAVVHALRVGAMAGQDTVLRGQRTASASAYASYLQARSLRDEYTVESLRRAETALEEALRLDATYAPAMASLAMTIADIDALSTADDERRQRARDVAERAVRAAPELADAYAARSFVRMLLSDWVGARADVEHALALKPGDAVVLLRYGDLLATTGRVAQAIAAFEKAAALDPLSAHAWRWLAALHNAAGNYPRASDAVEHALALAPSNVLALREKGFTLLLEGRSAQALALFGEHPTPYMRLTGVALAQHTLGSTVDARRALDSLRSLGGSTHYQIAEVYAWWGDADRAFEWLERARARRDVGLRYVKWDPFLRSVRSDPRYPALLRNMNMPVE